MAWLTRFLAAVAFLAIGVIFSPEIFGSKSDASNSIKLSTYLKLAHLLSFSTAFGAALWVTFIGGIIMFKNLPRHQFGNLQSKMFPAYFSMVGVCCAISVASFGYLHPWKSSSTAERYQLGFLLSSFAFNLANLFVFTPMTIELMRQRHKVEKENNIGEEIGWSKNVEVAKKNPKLAAMNKKFGMIHGLSSLANIMSFGGLAMHSWYLAGEPSILMKSEESGDSFFQTYVETFELFRERALRGLFKCSRHSAVLIDYFRSINGKATGGKGK